MDDNGSDEPAEKSGLTAAVPALSEGQREAIKLGAAYLNGIAIGIALVGGLSIPFSLVFSAPGTLPKIFAPILGLCSMLVSPYIHNVARRRLKELDR